MCMRMQTCIHMFVYTHLVAKSSLTLRPHGLKHTRLPCPSVSPRVCSNSCPLSQWSNHLILSLLVLLPSVFPSIRVFSNESVLHIRWPKYWSFSFSISSSNEYSGFISFRIDWVDLLVVQGTIKGSSPVPQFESISSLVLNLLYGPILISIHDYWKNHSFDYTNLCRQSEISAFNTLPRFVIAFLPKNKPLLISWLQPPSSMILKPKK